MFSITRITSTALAILALAAPTVAAMPTRDHVRNATSADTTPAVPGLPTWPTDPQPLTPPRAGGESAAEQGDGSALAYLIPGIAASILLASGMAYVAWASARTRRARARA